MDQIGIIILSLFAALGIAYLIMEIREWIIGGSAQAVRRVILELKPEENDVMLPFVVGRIAEQCRSGNRRVQVVVIDKGLTQEQVDALLICVPDLQIEKER
ncbi:MAG: hypothetical protein J6R33_02925 [Clostridia bacterium]|nr:hypothetical protein [Clostridia bacterium]